MSAPVEEAMGLASAPAVPHGDAIRLAADPPTVMRLSRKALALVGGAAGIAIGGALLWALRPVSHEEAPGDLYDAAANNPPEAVAGAPKDYGAVPKLGPPLPGDLGRPIVTAQQQGAAVPVPPIGQAPPDPQATRTKQARQRALQEREAARSSQMFTGAATDTSGAPVPEPGLPAAAAPVPAGRSAFLASAPAAPFESAERLRAPSNPMVLQAGSIIPAALITGIRSDMPGQVTAQVTQNIYDSPTGRHLLIPQGARLIGEYDDEIAAGQTRVLLAWDRLILPGGRSIGLDRQPGADAAGMAGLADRTDHHWGRLLKAALISSLLGIGAEIGTSDEDALVRALREGTQDTINQTGRKLVEREIGIAPTITVRPGFAFRVIVTRDLILAPAGEGQ